MAEPSLDLEDYEIVEDRGGVICDSIYTHLDEEFSFLEADYDSRYGSRAHFPAYLKTNVEENVVGVEELSDDEIKAAIGIYLENV